MSEIGSEANDRFWRETAARISHKLREAQHGAAALGMSANLRCPHGARSAMSTAWCRGNSADVRYFPMQGTKLPCGPTHD